MGCFHTAVPAGILLGILWLTALPTWAQMSDRYDSLLAEGVVHLNQGDLESAQYLFDLAAFEAPQRVEAYYYLGQVHSRGGRVDEAERTLQHALSLDPAFVPARFELAVLYDQQGRDQEALEAFEAVRKTDPERARVYLYEGRILQRQGRAKEAVGFFQQAATLDPAIAKEAHEEAGHAAREAGDVEAAQVAFQRAAASPEADAERIHTPPPGSDAVSERDEPRLALRLSLGVFYDDNVVLDPGVASASPLGVTDQADTMGVLSFWGRYRWLETDTWIGRAAYGFYQNRHREETLKPFDLQHHRVHLDAGPRLGRGELTFQYELQYALLGQESYLTSHDIGPRLVFPETEMLAAEIRYLFGVKRYADDVSLFATNSDRNVSTHRLALTQYAVWDKAHYIYGGYTFERDMAGDRPAEDDWTYTGHQLRVGLTWPVWASLRGDVDLSYTLRGYDNPNQQPPFAIRDDQELRGFVSVAQPFGRYVELALQYLHEQNQSNIPVFDYSRHLYGILLTAKY